MENIKLSKLIFLIFNYYSKTAYLIKSEIKEKFKYLIYLHFYNFIYF